MKRHEFSKSIKRAAWERSDGKCEHCTAELSPGNTRYDHINPDAAGGEAVLNNLQVLCRSCHDNKTFRGDVPLIAKLKRVRDRHIGIRRRKRSFPTNRDGPYKVRLTSNGPRTERRK